MPAAYLATRFNAQGPNVNCLTACAASSQAIGEATEMIRGGDDLGTQIGPLLGPRILREFLVPEYRRLFDLYRSRGVLINFHSCGRIDSVVDELMDMGVNILNPVQATANDLGLLRAKTQGRMTLQGGVSTATIMEGPPEPIVVETRVAMWRLGREGGYFCGPDQSLPFPPAHIEALRSTVEQFGVYPMDISDLRIPVPG